MKVITATKKDLGYLYSQSALTWEGMNTDEGNIEIIDEVLRNIGSDPIDGYVGYVVSGKLMNEAFGLTGSNAYKEDLHILSIPLDQFNCVNPLIMWRLTCGARWFDDIVDNNARREGVEVGWIEKAIQELATV